MKQRVGSLVAATSVALLLAACASRPPAPPLRTSYASDGAVTAQVVEGSRVEQYQNGPGVRYSGSGPAPDNTQPTYPPALLSRQLPPVTVDARLVVTTDGTVQSASVMRSSSTEAAFADAVLAAVHEWAFMSLTRVSGGEVERLPFSQEYRFTFRQVNGHAVVESGAHSE